MKNLNTLNRGYRTYFRNYYQHKYKVDPVTDLPNIYFNVHRNHYTYVFSGIVMKVVRQLMKENYLCEI